MRLQNGYPDQFTGDDHGTFVAHTAPQNKQQQQQRTADVREGTHATAGAIDVDVAVDGDDDDDDVVQVVADATGDNGARAELGTDSLFQMAFENTLHDLSFQFQRTEL